MNLTTFRRSCAGLAATIGLLGLLTAPAQASAAHNGTDPRLTQCNANAQLIATRPVRDWNMNWTTVTYVDVFYSYSCQTNWIRIRNNPYGGNATKEIWADNGDHYEENDPGYGSSYSMQVYAPGSTCINFRASLERPDGATVADVREDGDVYAIQRIC